MYIPGHFAVDDLQRVHEVIRRHPLGLLVTTQGGQLHMTHLPFHLVADGGNGRLEGHMARVNPHCDALRAGADSIVVFRGSDAYVSPRWYADPAHNVPTWNYVAIHAHGRPRVIDDPQLALDLIGRLTDEHEAAIPKPWHIAEAQQHAGRLLPYILAFDMTITRLEGKFKLSQNRQPADRLGVMQALDASGLDAHQEMLEMMESLYTGDGETRPG